MAMIDNHESNFDLYVHKLLTDSGIDAEYQHTSLTELQNALATASKSQTGAHGMPDFIATVGEYLLIIEDKADRDKLCLRNNDGSISLDVKATKDYALNGALWYARKIIEHGAYTKIFAFGNAGDPKHHTLKPVFVSGDTVKELAEVETFGNFAPGNIDAYYHSAVLGEIPPEELRIEELRKKAETLHEHLRNYGQLGDKEKPLVVSAILLALMAQERGFSLDNLTGDQVEGNTDGDILFTQMESSLKRAQVKIEVNLPKVRDQFTLIKNRPILTTLHQEWKDEKNPDGKPPLKYFAEYINKEIYSAIRSGSSPDDYLGMFYSEFMRYSGGDGQTLGIVLTPPHITELFCDLLDIKADDVIFDPCCGTGGFLVAGMHRLFQLAKNESQRKHVREKQIHDIEIRDDMFAVATTNMILRGDGKSNLTCEDFLTKDPNEIQLKQITVGFMNPPYSQAKNKATQNLSELKFISRLLDCILEGGRAAVIVPVSVMIGKTKEDRQLKSDILKHHTLEGVISLNKDTFYGVGTVPCIAIFTAGEPHPAEKLVKFINFQNDGWEVKMHRGLVETESAKDRRQYLLDCWRGKITDAPSSFMVMSAVEESDEWLHSFYYYNDEIPAEEDFAGSLADYLTFEFSMVIRGRGYLFGEESCVGGDKKKRLSLEGLRWGMFHIRDIFTISPGKRFRKEDMTPGNIPFVGASDSNNGVTAFISDSNASEDSNVLGVNYDGSIAECFYHPYTCLFSDSVKRFHIIGREGNKYIYLFVKALILQQKGKYNYGYKFNDTRMQAQQIMLPVDDSGRPDWNFMEGFMREHERVMIEAYISRVSGRITGGDIPSLDGVKWSGFRIGDLFSIIQRGKRLKNDDHIPGNIPYVSSSAMNNGVDDFVGNVEGVRMFSDCITIANSGSVGSAFYHSYEFVASDHVTALKSPGMNKYIYMFIATTAKSLQAKYSFNREINEARINREKIMLPTDNNGNPDWPFITQYMKALEDSLLLTWLNRIILRHMKG